MGSTITKDGVTPAEISMLMSIHGEVSVSRIAESGVIEGNAQTERERLGKLFRDEKVHQLFGPYGGLPTEINEVKIPESMFLEKPSASKKKAPAKKKKAASVERNVVDDEPVAGI